MSILNDPKTDPNRILPIRYPWAREWYRAAVANNWTPEEIGMQEDVEQWKSRLERLGMPKRYHTANPFPWMSQSVDLPKEKNCFETRVTEYRTGGALTWD